MEKLRSRIATLALLILVFLGTSPYDGEAAAPTRHVPILIQGNSAFTPGNGITGGTGTEADPYLIEGWEINLSLNPATFAITVIDTDLPFVIRNVSLHSGNLSYGGIRLTNVTNARVENSQIHDDATGLYITHSTNLTLSGNNVTSNRFDGIAILSSANIKIIGNSVSQNNGAGIYIELPSTNVLAYQNSFLNNNIQAVDRGENTWDAGYSVGGNLWSNYGGPDNCSGPNQDLCGTIGPPNPDGIGDWVYTLDSNSIDRYPIMPTTVKEAGLYGHWYWYLVPVVVIGAGLALFPVLRAWRRRWKESPESNYP